MMAESMHSPSWWCTQCAPLAWPGLQVCELEETFAGPIWLASTDASAPLRSRPLTTRLKGGKGGGTKGSLARKVHVGMHACMP